MVKEYWTGRIFKGKGRYVPNSETFHGFAITNAERLDAMNEGKTPASSAPGTKVHELIKHLRPY